MSYEKKKSGLLFSGLAAVLLLSYLFFNPILVNLPPSDVKLPEYSYTKGEIFNPLMEYDFDVGKFTAYLILKERVNVNGMPPGSVFKTTNVALLKQMQQNMLFSYTGGDLATVENDFLLYKGDELIFRTGVVLDENSQGFQSPYFGWIEAKGDNVLSGYCGQFSVCFPVIVFPE